MSANEVSFELNTGPAEQKLERLVGLIRDAEAALGRLNTGGISGPPAVGTPGVSAGAGTGGGVGASVISQAPGPTGAAAAAQAQVQLSAAQQSIASQLYGAGLSPVELRQAWGQVGLPGAPQAAVPPPAALSPNAIAVSLIQSAQASMPRFDANRTTVFDAIAMNRAHAAMMPAGAGMDPTVMMATAAMRGGVAGGIGPSGMSHTQSMRLQLAGGAAALGIGQAFGLSAESTVSGRVSPTGIGGMIGGTIGGIAGAFSGNPLIAAGAAMIGSQVGSYIGAPIERAYAINASFAPGVGLTQDPYRGGFGAGSAGLNAWAMKQAGRINTYEADGYRQNVTAASLGAGYSTMTAALIGSGIDPMQTLGGTGFAGTPGTAGHMSWPSGRPRGISGSGGAVGAAAGLASQAAQFMHGRWAPGTPGQPGYGDETLPQAISRRIHEQYPNDEAATAVIKTISPIWHSIPYNQQNAADIISKFGAVGYMQFRQSQRDVARGGRGGMDPAMAAVMTEQDREMAGRFEASMQSTQRGIDYGGMSVRGSGLAVAGAYLDRMTSIAAMPGGSESVAFRTARSGYMGAAKTAFEQGSSATYGIASSNIDAARGIAASSPFAPGNRFAIELLGIRVNQQQIGNLRNFMEGRRASGLLSEDEELELTDRINSLRVSNARSVGALSEGVENRLPALFAGRSGGFRRFDSTQMAALNAFNSGSPVRSFGAMGGRHERMQNEFVSSFGAGNIGPFNPTGNLNPAGGGTDNGTLRQILVTLERIAGQGGRGGGGGGLAPMGGRQPGGSGTPFN